MVGAVNRKAGEKDFTEGQILAQVLKQMIEENTDLSVEIRSRLGTNVSPLRPTTALATDGIFSWTRNPLYIGGTLVMFGIALVFAIDWLLLLIPPSLLILHFGVVRREEEYLERKFGDPYRRYRLNVARYGFGI